MFAGKLVFILTCTVCVCVLSLFLSLSLSLCARALACPRSVGVAWVPLLQGLILLDRAAEKQAHTNIDEPLSSLDCDCALMHLDSALVCQPRASCSAFHEHYSVIKLFAHSCRLAGSLKLTAAEYLKAVS